MSRSVKKGPYIDFNLFKKIEALNSKNEKKVVKTWSRSCTIFPEMVEHTIAVHDGKKHVMDFKLEDLENQLDPVEFVRANRQYILSRASIVAIESHFNSRVNVKVQPAASFPVIISKEKVTSFKRWFEEH